jgi:hypothetical protein
LRRPRPASVRRVADAPPIERLPLKEAIAALERKMILEALDRAAGNHSEAARQLAIAGTQLYLEMTEHGIAGRGDKGPALYCASVAPNATAHDTAARAQSSSSSSSSSSFVLRPSSSCASPRARARARFSSLFHDLHLEEAGGVAQRTRSTQRRGCRGSSLLAA